MHRKMVKSDLISGLISGGHIRPGRDMAGYENLARFRPGPDMISGATLVVVLLRWCNFMVWCVTGFILWTWSSTLPSCF